MGDRICLTFTDGKSFSPTLYAHWDGIILIERARDFYEEFNGKIRAEPENWMVNFISYLRKGKVCDGYYYLYPCRDASASPDDNGYWMMNTKTGEVKRY